MAKTELEAAGESTDGMVESTAKLREEILALSGVDIMLDPNTFKSTYQIMDELSQKWEGLSDIAQASITELMAGKHQGNIMSSLMSNFDTARKALETSQNSAGSAMAEHAKWSDSLEARLNKLKATWQSLSQSFLKSNFLKGGINVLTDFVNVIDTIIDKFGTLPTLIGAFAGGLSLFKNQGIFKFDKDANSIKIFGDELLRIKSAISEVRTSLGALNVKNGFTSTIDRNDISSIRNYTNAISNGVSETVAFNRCMTDASDNARAYAQSGKAALHGVKGFVEEQQAIQVSMVAQNKTFSSAKVLLEEYNNGCKTTGMSQKAFADGVAQMNPQLAKAMTSTSSVAGGLVKYTASLVGAKVASFALQAATIALNAALTMGISLAISAAIKAFDEWYVSAKELSEKVDEVTSKYKEQHDSLMKLKKDYDTTNESSMISKYAELSKGVDAFGKNLSLTADEYEEYQNIVGTIADQIPSLVSGYDSQGNAILSCAGNVGELTKAYEELIRTQNNEVLVNSAKDINNDFKNAVKDAEYNTEGWFGGADWTQELGLGASKLSTESAKAFKNILESKDALDEFNKVFDPAKSDADKELLTDLDAMSDLLENAGFEKKWYESDKEHVEKALKENKAVVKNIIDNYYADLETEVEGKKAQAEATLSNAFDISDSIYYGMSDTMKNIAKQTVGGFDFEFFADLEDQGISVEEYIKNMLNQLNALKDIDEASIEAAFNLRTQFNDGEISYGEYVKGLENTGNLVDDLVSDGALDKEVGTQIKLSLGLDEEGLVENYKTLTNKLKEVGLDDTDAKGLLDNLTAEEFSVLNTKIIPEIDAGATREQIEAAIDREMVLSGLIFDLNLEVEVAGIESLNTALAESVTASGLSSESISALKGRYADLEAQGWDLSSMFEETSHGIHVNRNELSKFENELSKQKLAKVNGDLERMKAEYDKLGEAIKTASDADKSKLFNERQSLAQKISEAATLASQYQGLTSAYNQWLATEEAGNERDMYENVISGFETVKDELSRGWADDGTIAFLEMLTGRTDLAGKSGKELKEVYNSLDKTIKNTTHSVKDFFTVDEEGNSTSKGVYNFLDAVGQLEEEEFGGKDVVKRDKKGNVIGFDFELAGGDEAIAEALGVSEELVQIMVRAADDAGFVVSMDGTYRQLADLENEAKAAADKLKEIFGEEYSFDFNTSNVSDLTTQLDKAKELLDKTDKDGNKLFWNEDGTFNFDADGAEQAMTVVSTLQAKIDTLTQDKYGIGLTVEDKEFEEPLKNLQSYGEKVALLNQLELNPEVHSEEIDKLNGELDDIAEYFATLDTDTKVKLGFEAGDGIEEVKSKIESGEVKIPTTLDIQTNMDKNIADLKDLMLLNFLDPNSEEAMAIKIRLGIEAEPDENAGTEVQNAIDTVVNGVNNGTTTVEPEVEVEPEVKKESFWGKFSNWWNEKVRPLYGGSTPEPIEVETEVEIKPASEVIVSDNFESDVKTGAEGRLNGMGVDVDAQVNVDAKVDTSKAEEKTKEKTEEAVESQSGETTTLEKDVQLEFNISDYIGELSKFKDVAKELDGLDDVSLTVTANFEGTLKNSDNIQNLVTFAEGAKELKGVKGSTVSITANVYGNVLEKTDDLTKLKTFADGAKELDGVEGSHVSVTANIDSNIDSVKNLAGLTELANGAKALDGLQNKEVEVSVTANLDGEFASWTGDVNDLIAFADVATTLQKVTSSPSVTITANASGNAVQDGGTIRKLKDFVSVVESVEGKQKVNINVAATVNTASITQAIDAVTKLSKNSNLFKDYSSSITVETTITGDDKIDSIATNLGKIDNKSITVTVNADGAVSALDTIIQKLKEITDKDINVNVSGGKSESGATGGSATGTINYKVGNVDKPENAVADGTVNYKVGNVDKPNPAPVSEGTINYKLGEVANANDKDGEAVATATVNYKKGTQDEPIDLFATVNYSLGTQDAPKEKTATVNYALGDQDNPLNKTAFVTYVESGSVANGTAHAGGTASGHAFAHGDWGVKKTQTALTGELGRELVVYGNKWFTVGDTGAEFATIPKGAIVFNHKQTEEIFKNGYVTSGGGRGKAFASGTAFSGGSKGSGGGMWENAVTGKKYKKSSKSSSKDDSQETFDWIEILIDRIERAIDRLATKADSVYRSWAERNQSLTDEIAKVGEEISIQQQAYDKYMEAAAGVGLDEEYAEKVRNGEIDLETIKDETLKEKIADYQEYYEKALDCQDAILELKEAESELYAQRFEHVQSQYDGILQGYEHTQTMLEEYISQAEEQGFVVSKKYYQALIDNEKSNIAELKKEQEALIAARDEAVESGAIAKGSEAWYEQCAAIDEITQAIEESTTALLEFDNAMREIDFGIFDLIQERISAVSDEADFLIDLMSNEKLFDDDGKLTSQGLATMALHAQNANSHMYQADEYGAEVAKLNEMIKNDPYDQELINRRNELLELQRESILAAEDEKNSIRDLVEEGINLELDALQERIDKYNESIEAAKDLYDYQKDVQEQSEEIAALEKQRASYLNDSSEEGKRKLQEIEVSLKEAKENLQETEYERYIDDQQKLLDELYSEYELTLNTRLDNVDMLLESVIESINTAASADGTIASALGSEGAIALAVSNNATSIKSTLESEAKNVGTTLSSAMNNIWSTGDGNAKSVLTMYGEDFRTKSTTIIATLNSIKTSVNSMVASLNKEAEKKVASNKTSTSAKKNPTTSSTTTKKATTTKKPSGDGKPKIGDRVKYVSGQYYYDSQGKKPLGSHNKGEYVYITNINTRDWATHGYHISTGKKLGSGDLGWLKLNQLSGYETGKEKFYDDENAWTQENGKREFIVRPSDGAILTPIAKGDSILNAAASGNIWSMANNPVDFIKENLKLDASSVPNASNVNSSVVQHFENITFSMPNVHGYNDLLTEMQKDPKFEKLILSMTIDQIAGKSSLGKGKSIR